jgi:HEPN domain-containing protein
MKPGRETALRWLRQAEHDLRIACGHQERGDYSDACFMAEQAAQKALKGFLMAQGQHSVPSRSVPQLASHCAQCDADFAAHVTTGRL